MQASSQKLVLMAVPKLVNIISLKASSANDKYRIIQLAEVH
jgi:hypothetical protein